MIFVAALLARDAGLECLKALLARTAEFKIVALATHRYLPKSESLSLIERPEFSAYQKISKEYAIPFMEINSGGALTLPALDLLISCSWRFKVAKLVLDEARIGCINLHRGKLPQYAGAEPVRRALENGERSIVVTAHEMEEEIDRGAVLAEAVHPAVLKSGETVAQATARIKKEILPLYPKVMFESAERLSAHAKR